MVLDAFFRRASETFPIPVMLRALLERVFEPARLNDWFEAVTEKQYTRELLFSSAFELMSVVVFKAFGSVHAAYQAKRTAGEITVSVTSVYNKLNGVEAQTSRALVRDTAGHLRHLVEDVQGGCRPWLPGYRVKVLDGNCIAATEHRLQVLRTTAAGPLPGKALVVYDPAVEMAIDVFPCEDGHAQERALLGEVVPTVQAGDLWIMDRNFCVRAFLAGIEARAGTFLCRYHKGLPVTALAPARFVGSIETGKVYEQQVEVLMAPRPGEDADDVRIYRLVRVELTRATRGGDKTLLLLTDLSKSAATGKQVAELYRRRWTIETMFQQLEAHLHSEVNTLGYPAAALFAFCVALVAYNVLAVVKGALRGLHGEQTIHDTVSGYYIAGEIGRTYEALRDGEALGIGAEVVVLDPFGAAVPLGAGIAERADEFLLLGIDADDRDVVGGAALAQFGDVPELVVAPRMGSAGELLVVDAQRIAHRLEQSSDRPGADVDAERAQLVGNLGGRTACPLQAADRVAGRLVVHQGFDAGDDFRRFFSVGVRPPPARRTRSTSTSRSTSCRRPAATVDGSMPSSRAMRRSPPHPHLRASRPANSRRCRSSSRLANNTMAARNCSGIRSASGRGCPSPGVASSRRLARTWCVCCARSAAQ